MGRLPECLRFEEHDCLDHLRELPDDPCLPPHVTKHECEVCEQWFDYDREIGEYEVDN